MYISAPLVKYHAHDIVRQSTSRRTYGVYGEHPRWRRLTGITYAIEARLEKKDRKKGLRRLTRWLEKNWRGIRKPRPQLEDGPGVPGGADCGSGTAGQLAASPRLPIPASRPAADLSLAHEWNLSATTWTCVQQRGPSVESLCRDLEIRKGELTTLLREHCGLSADEVVDNFRLHKLQAALRDRVRTAAQSIWGSPHDMVERKVCEAREAQESTRRQRIDELIASRLDGQESSASNKVICPSREKREQERVDRIEELVVALRKDFDLAMWAEQLGYASPARLKRACLRVLGRSLLNLERVVATEVVKFYMAAESKALRAMAMEKGKDEYTRIARLLYWGVNEPPKAPFCDDWSLYEIVDKNWLEGMVKEFG